MRRCGLVLAVLMILGVTAGCAARPVAGLAIGSSTRTITVDGRVRTYHLYRPAASASPAPLVVMLHGGFGSGTQAEQSYGWDPAADSGHFLVAYPDGINRAWAVGGGCCGTPGATGVDDIAFIAAMVRDIQGLTPVDPARIYATGISNGGMLAYRLACDTNVFAAIGPDSATQLGSCPSPAPISILHIHGTADQNIPYNGGEGQGVAHIDGPAVPALVASWRSADGCGPPGVSTAGVVTTSTATCPDGRSVELITIAGAGHQWPGSASKPLIQKALGLDAPSTALNATATLWRFFAAHPKP
jgi:polyhydroxybutyrate depolymerase